jgi:hypothetical protein
MAAELGFGSNSLVAGVHAHFLGHGASTVRGNRIYGSRSRAIGNGVASNGGRPGWCQPDIAEISAAEQDRPSSRPEVSIRVWRGSPFRRGT